MAKRESMRSVLESVVSEYIAENGGIKAEELYALAEPDDSPIHGVIEWDDLKAGREYRLIQCRRLLKEIKIEYASHDASEPIEMVLQWVPSGDKDEKAGAYRPLALVVEDNDEYDRALGYCVRLLESAKNAVERLVDSAPEERRNDVAVFSEAVSEMESAVSVLTC